MHHDVLPSTYDEVDTPALILDLDRLRRSVADLPRELGRLRPQIFDAVKANGHPRLLTALHEAGRGFDVASIHEIRALRELDVPTSCITFSATVKVPEHVAAAERRPVAVVR